MRRNPMRRPIDLSLYLVTDRGKHSLEDFFCIVRKSIEGGVTAIQLREKEISNCEMIALAKSLHALLRPLEIPLIINDRVEVARAVNAEGVHLGQSDLKIAEARAILGNQAIIGLSVNSPEQVMGAEEEDVDYLAAGPVFFTQTKADCGKPCGLDLLKHLCSKSHHPIVAIGGINEANIKSVMLCGVAGIAVVSSIFNAPCPKKAAFALSRKVPTALSIAGFDGSGGAGIQADLKTFSALGCYGTTVLTALPIQNTQGVRAIYEIEPLCVEEQMKAVLDDVQMDAVKIGMLHNEEIIVRVAYMLRQYSASKIVLDPVMVAKSGDKLLLPNAVAAMQKHLFPMTTLLTPNLPEASILLGRAICTKEDMESAALELINMGPLAVVIKGGHLKGSCDDCVCLNSSEIHWLSSPRILTRNTHGTGCTFSAAIAAFLAQGATILDAIRKAKSYLTKSIEAGALLKMGQGNGPVHHFHHSWSLLND